MKKVGVLTSFFATNFGAALQCYALKKVLEEMGYDVEYIPYKQPGLYRLFYPVQARNILARNPVSVYHNLLSFIQKYRKWRNFERFRTKYITDKQLCTTIPEDKDYYILGSDQIWNPHITKGFDDVFWGKFKRKEDSTIFSYAASTENMQYLDHEKQYIKNAINSLDYVSVREDQFNLDLSTICGRNDIVTVLDPTLLLDMSKYENIGLRRPMNDKYVLFYRIRQCNHFIPCINEYAKSIGARLLILSSGIVKELKLTADKDDNIIYEPLVGVEYFLSAVKYAEHIFTPSFHGTAFSIIFKKAFNTLVLDDNWNTRTNDLLSKAGLMDRKIYAGEKINNTHPDYDIVFNNLEYYQNHSMAFLQKALS